MNNPLPESFCSALQTLEKYPPAPALQPARIEAFLQIGRFLEESIRPGAPLDLVLNPHPLWGMIARRLDTALSEEENNRNPSGGWQLRQMYNSGVLLRKQGITVGIDLLPVLRTYGWPDTHNLTQRTAALLDMLLITHRHPDHYDRALVQACLALGKPVCMPEDLCTEWTKTPNLHPFRHETTVKLCSLQITGRRALHVWRETADELPLIYYEINDPDGHTLLFAGDADYTKDFTCTTGRTIDTLFLPWRNPNNRFEDGSPVQTGTTADALQIAILPRVADAFRKILQRRAAELLSQP